MSGRPETVLTALAVNKLGAVRVPVNTDYRGDWLVDAVRGDLGTNWFSGEEVTTELSDRIPVTLGMAFGGLLIAGLALDALGRLTRLPRITLLVLFGLLIGSARFSQ